MAVDAVHFGRALAMLPASPWVMSSIYETTRTGVLVRRVMQCADDPVCLCVSIRKGSRIDPVVRDSHVFAVSLMPGIDRLLLKKFDTPEATDEDPFDAFAVRRLRTGSPIMARAIAAFDCEVLSHVDLEADSELFVGRVLEVCVGGLGGGVAEGHAPT
jgi:flavin reductase (DIM6/NTAB) family NADH-FMN oxidoreductase RutF